MEDWDGAKKESQKTACSLALKYCVVP